MAGKEQKTLQKSKLKDAKLQKEMFKKIMIV